MHINVKVGVKSIARVCKLDDGTNDKPSDSNWWDWGSGSTLFFWRWHPDMIRQSRSGTPAWKLTEFEPYKQRQSWPSEPNHKEKMTTKLIKAVRRGYIKKGPVVSLTGFFAVPKGESDIRMVYDATKCGLNNTLWAPTFLLPTIDTTLRQVDIGGFMSDINLSEMFLNFPLDEKIMKYAGVDLTGIRRDLAEAGVDLGTTLGHQRLFMRWTCCLMGLKSSPFCAVWYFAWAEEFVRGNIRDPANVFGYDKVICNLPGMSDYDPSLPNVRKVQGIEKVMVANFAVYIDDIQIFGGTLREVVKAAQRIASRSNYLGIQDAPRKRRFPSRVPGVWSGAKSISTEVGLYTCMTQEKWDKGKCILMEWKKEYAASKGKLDRKNMERGRGFLIHLARTYPSMVAHLKGVHHVIDSWRPGRNQDGWKLSGLEWRMFLDELVEARDREDDGYDWKEERKSYLSRLDGAAPALVDGTKVKRFLGDINHLLDLMSNVRPPQMLIRGKQVLVVQYGFGDASGGGFGAAWESNSGIYFRFGVWSESSNKGKSSNYWELTNLVETIEGMAKDKGLAGQEIYFFTDNSTAKRSYYKGTSLSPLLHDLVFRLRMLEMSQGCRIVLCHVAGKRMIAQGVDGLSQGNMSEGVMKGLDMKSFLPLHLNCFERNPVELKSWLLSVFEQRHVDGLEMEFLEPIDWYSRGHDHKGSVRNCDGYWLPKTEPGLLVWSPPPAAADVALEELRQARLKRTSSIHLFVCLRLMEPLWRKHLHKSADLVMDIPCGTSFWPTHMFEPLVLGIYFPYLSHRPWELKRAPAIMELGRRMCGMWKEDEKSAEFILRKLRKQERSFQHLSPKLVFKMLRSYQQLGVSCE